jgi:hypothetical protein
MDDFSFVHVQELRQCINHQPMGSASLKSVVVTIITCSMHSSLLVILFLDIYLTLWRHINSRCLPNCLINHTREL